MSEKLLKIGVRFKPPALTLLYELENEARRIRVMPIRFINKTGDLSFVIKELKDYHQILSQIDDIRIEKILRMIQLTQSGIDPKLAIEKVKKEYEVDPKQDLNKLTDEELHKKKKTMDSNFEKNRVKKNDENFEYDIQVNFENSNKIEAGWDSSGSEKSFWT